MANQPEQSLEGNIPANVTVGINTLITGEAAFKRFHSKRQPALEVGGYCTMDGVHFALGKDAYVAIGNYCYFTSAILLCEMEIRIGDYVVLGWNVTLADNDFHPIEPAERIADALACSPLGKGRPRPVIAREPIIIEDDVWIGPNATILKGVRIGSGSFIEPGALVTHDIPKGVRVIGNPARVIGTV